MSSIDKTTMLLEVTAVVEDEKGFPGSDEARPEDGGARVVRFRWQTGAWLCYVQAGERFMPWPEDRPWPRLAVDLYVEGGGRIVPAQLRSYRARPCMLHGEPFESCGCPTMYETLATEQRLKAERQLAEIAKAAETAKPDPTESRPPAPAQDAVNPSGASPAPSAADALAAAAGDASTESDWRVGPGADAPDAPGLIWSFRCLDCRREMARPPLPAAGVSCPECGHRGVLVWRADQPAPPDASWADVIAADGGPERPDGSACYVCGGPIAAPGGAMARLRGGHARAHLACVQTRRNREGSSAARPFVRVGSPDGYCQACKTPFKGGELTLLGGRVHADAKACQAGPEPPAIAPVGKTLKRRAKGPCVVCEAQLEVGMVVCKHLDGLAHVLCITMPPKPLEELPL